MKFRQVLAAFLGTAVVIGAAGVTSAADAVETAVDVSRAEGIKVAFHTRDEIRGYLKNHPFDMNRKAEYAQTPVTWAPYRAGKLSDTDIREGLNALNSMRYIAGVGVKDVILCHYGNDYAQAGSLACCIKGALTHNPGYIQGMDSTLSMYAKFGCQQSNLASGFNNVAHSVVLGYLYDTNEKNISALGHRRWCLNPPMDVTGFGQVNNYSAMYAVSDGYKAADNYGVCWPAQNMPLEYFPTDTAWSISMGYRVDAASVEVTLTRQSDGEVWTFSNESADGFFTVSNDDYGQQGCIIFRPDNVGGFSHGDVYTVDIDGLRTPVSYNVNFFNIDGDDSVFDAQEPSVPDEPDDPVSGGTEETPSDPETSDLPDDNSGEGSGDSDTTESGGTTDSSDDPGSSETPAKGFKDSGTGVEITAAPDAFPEGTELVAVPDEDKCTDTRYTCDLSFVCGGKKVQPSGSVNVSMPIPSSMRKYKTLYVFHVEGGCYNFVQSVIKNGCVVFDADSFSPYVISAEDLSGQSVDGEQASDSSAVSSESEAPSDNPSTGIAAAFLPLAAIGTALFIAARRKR